MIYLNSRRFFKQFSLIISVASAIGYFTAETPAAAAEGYIGEMETHTAEPHDTFVALAQKYDIGYDELIAANPGIDPWLPAEGAQIMLPKQHILPKGPHEGLVVNLGEMRIFYYPPGGEPESFAIGMGRDGFMTPSGGTTVVRKAADPPWYRTASERADKPELPAIVPPGPDNPLGAFALYLGWPSYLIHGTDDPRSVGRLASRGCIRMYPAAINELYERIPIGTKVTVIDQPVKFAKINGGLYVSVFPSRTQANELEDHNSFTPAAPDGFTKMVLAAAGPDSSQLDWDAVRQAANDRKGYPVLITK